MKDRTIKVILEHVKKVGIFDAAQEDAFKEAPFVPVAFEALVKKIQSHQTENSISGIHLPHGDGNKSITMGTMPFNFLGDYYVLQIITLQGKPYRKLMTLEAYENREITKRAKKLAKMFISDYKEEDLRDRAVVIHKSAMDRLLEMGVTPPDPKKQQLYIDCLTGKRSYDDYEEKTVDVSKCNQDADERVRSSRRTVCKSISRYLAKIGRKIFFLEKLQC